MENTRFEFIDRMKGIAIILVIVGHIIQFNNIDGGTNNKIFNIIYSFHMPLFFILSGYVASRGVNRIINLGTLKNFLWKKIYTLIVPLLTWTLFVEKFFFAEQFEYISTDDVVNALLHPGLWFLQTIFEIQILFGIFSLCCHFLNKNGSLYMSIVIAGSVFIFPLLGFLLIDKPHFLTLILFTGFFFIGSFISKYSHIEKFIMNQSVFTMALILFLVLVGHWSIQGNTIDVILKVFISIIAFITLLHLTKGVDSINSFVDSQIQLFGKESLAIYVMQFFLTSRILFLSELKGTNLFVQFLLIFMIAIPIAYFCVFTHQIFKKSNVLDFLLYGKK
ncbi:acyltransferase family protein [Flavobacterium eburneipallidum]|uniref:acyltransferase family protein n=1 Tax=Flavobacterium eburneipallidum TaxID=3003263 RepID=UPI0024832933|nr:acyltransferase family protein [Flavobacterium eburneipallidum]